MEIDFDKLEKAYHDLINQIKNEVNHQDVELFNKDGESVYAIEEADYVILKTDVGKEKFFGYCEKENIYYSYDYISEEDDYYYLYYDYDSDMWKDYKHLHNKVVSIDKIFGLKEGELL